MTEILDYKNLLDKKMGDISNITKTMKKKKGSKNSNSLSDPVSSLSDPSPTSEGKKSKGKKTMKKKKGSKNSNSLSDPVSSLSDPVSSLSDPKPSSSKEKKQPKRDTKKNKKTKSSLSDPVSSLSDPRPSSSKEKKKPKRDTKKETKKEINRGTKRHKEKKVKVNMNIYDILGDLKFNKKATIFNYEKTLFKYEKPAPTPDNIKLYDTYYKDYPHEKIDIKSKTYKQFIEESNKNGYIKKKIADKIKESLKKNDMYNTKINHNKYPINIFKIPAHILFDIEITQDSLRFGDDIHWYNMLPTIFSNDNILTYTDGVVYVDKNKIDYKKIIDSYNEDYVDKYEHIDYSYLPSIDEDESDYSFSKSKKKFFIKKSKKHKKKSKKHKKKSKKHKKTKKFEQRGGGDMELRRRLASGMEPPLDHPNAPLWDYRGVTKESIKYFADQPLAKVPNKEIYFLSLPPQDDPTNINELMELMKSYYGITDLISFQACSAIFMKPEDDKRVSEIKETSSDEESSEPQFHRGRLDDHGFGANCMYIPEWNYGGDKRLKSLLGVYYDQDNNPVKRPDIFKYKTDLEDITWDSTSLPQFEHIKKTILLNQHGSVKNKNSVMESDDRKYRLWNINWPDGTPGQDHIWDIILSCIVRNIIEDRTIAIHCWGGRGRTMFGVALACIISDIWELYNISDWKNIKKIMKDWEKIASLSDDDVKTRRGKEQIANKADELFTRYKLLENNMPDPPEGTNRDLYKALTDPGLYNHFNYLRIRECSGKRNQVPWHKAKSQTKVRFISHRVVFFCQILLDNSPLARTDPDVIRTACAKGLRNWVEDWIKTNIKNSSYNGDQLYIPGLFNFHSPIGGFSRKGPRPVMVGPAQEGEINQGANVAGFINACIFQKIAPAVIKGAMALAGVWAGNEFAGTVGAIGAAVAIGQLIPKAKQYTDQRMKEREKEREERKAALAKAAEKEAAKGNVAPPKSQCLHQFPVPVQDQAIPVIHPANIHAALKHQLVDEAVLIAMVKEAEAKEKAQKKEEARAKRLAEMAKLEEEILQRRRKPKGPPTKWFAPTPQATKNFTLKKQGPIITEGDWAAVVGNHQQGDLAKRMIEGQNIDITKKEKVWCKKIYNYVTKRPEYYYIEKNFINHDKPHAILLGEDGTYHYGHVWSFPTYRWEADVLHSSHTLVQEWTRKFKNLYKHIICHVVFLEFKGITHVDFGTSTEENLMIPEGLIFQPRDSPKEEGGWRVKCKMVREYIQNYDDGNLDILINNFDIIWNQDGERESIRINRISEHAGMAEGEESTYKFIKQHYPLYNLRLTLNLLYHYYYLSIKQELYHMCPKVIRMFESVKIFNVNEIITKIDRGPDLLNMLDNQDFQWEEAAERGLLPFQKVRILLEEIERNNLNQDALMPNEL